MLVCRTARHTSTAFSLTVFILETTEPVDVAVTDVHQGGHDSWLSRAQTQGRFARCDTETLASTILGALHGWAFTARVFGESTAPAAGAHYVERFVELLWNGLAGGKS